MLRFLTVVGLALLVTTGWPALRGIRRSRRIALPALRPRPATHRGAVLRALRISRGRGRRPLTREAKQAAVALRLRAAAYPELMAAADGPHWTARLPLADAS